MSGKLDDVAGRLDSAASIAMSMATRVSGTEDDVSALRTYVEDAGARLTSLLTETKRSLVELDARTSSLEQDDATAQSALASHELAERVDGLDASLRAAGEERAVNASEIARVAAILEVERASLRTKVDALVSAAQASATAPDAVELERRVTRLTSRVESLDGDRASAQAQFDAIANALASTPHDSTLEQRLDELARRIDAVEQHGAAVASKVSHTNALLPTALRSLEARLDDVAPGTRTVGRELGAEDPHDAQPDEADETSEALDAADRATAAVVPLRTGDP